MLRDLLQSPEETLQKIQNEGGIIKPRKDLSKEGRIVGELTPALLLLHHYWRDSDNKAELIKAKTLSLTSRGEDTDDMQEEYVKVETLGELARKGFWIVVNEEFNVWNIESLVVGQIEGRPVIVEKNPEKESHEGMTISVGGIGGPASVLRALHEVLSDDCGDPNCPIHHSKTCHPKDRKEKETEN